MELPLAAAVAFLTIAAVFLAVLLLRERQITKRLRRQNGTLADELRVREQELGHLVSARLPALMDSLHGRPVAVPGPLHGQRAASADQEKALRRILEMTAELVEQAKTSAERSATATLRAMMRGVQSLANEQQVAISAMQERHDDPGVLEGLLGIDHMNAQLGRRTQATAVLCGSWPGQQRSASTLSDVVRGATSRIRDYLRVRVNGEMGVAVVSRAVEPVVLALAELLDNAARHSQPTTPVEVNFQQAHNGVAVMIDDAGVAMEGGEMQRAARVLSGAQPVDVHGLGDPPRVGFAVTGLLATRYGFSVSVDTRSPYGGVRAVVFLPTALLTRIDDAAAPSGAHTVTSGVTEATASRGADGTAAMGTDATAGGGAGGPRRAPEVTASGLAKRRRTTRVTPPDADAPGSAADAGAPAADAGRPAEPPAERPNRPARDIAAGLGAWQRGTRSGRGVPHQDTPHQGDEPRPHSDQPDGGWENPRP